MHEMNARVRYSECNHTGHLSIVGALNYLQDCSTFESAKLGFDVAPLAADASRWILGGWHLEVGELPLFGTPITISTWAHDVKRTRCQRSFVARVSASDQKPAAEPFFTADSLWFVYNPTTGHIERLPESINAYSQDAAPLSHPIPAAPRKLDEAPFSASLTSSFSYLVRERDLDANGHVNNAQYLQVALDALEDAGYAVAQTAIDIVYLQMAFVGDTIHAALFAHADDPTHLMVKLTNQHNDLLTLITFTRSSHVAS